MLIMRVDYHPSFQQVAFLGQETGEYDERRLNRVMEKRSVYILFGDDSSDSSSKGPFGSWPRSPKVLNLQTDSFVRTDYEGIDHQD